MRTGSRQASPETVRGRVRRERRPLDDAILQRWRDRWPVRGLVLLRHDPHTPKKLANRPPRAGALTHEARRIEVDETHSCSLARLLQR
jgi:hypothetical protein